MTDGCVWLYAVHRDDPAVQIAASGVDGERVHGVLGGELTALVGDVDGLRFGPRALERNLERLDWLADVARAHDAVVREAATYGAVVPVRMATLFQTENAVRAMLIERKAEFATVLDAVAGRAEWGVKAYLDPEAWAEVVPGAAERSGAGEGSTYLLRRRAQLAAKSHAEHEAAQWTQAAHARLCEVCAASRVHRPQSPQLSGRDDSMILNASYLVDQDRVQELRALIAELGEGRKGVEVQLTGPWPPYSFAALAEVRDD